MTTPETRVQSTIESHIANEALRESPAGTPRVRELGHEVHNDAVDRIAVEHRRRLRESPLARVQQVVNYLFGLLYGIIALEIILELFGARDSNPFKHFLDIVTGPFLAPFRSILPIAKSGAGQLIPGFLVALGVYALIHVAVHKLLTMLARPRTSL